MINSNIVGKEKTRSIQLQTMDIIKKALLRSYGPNGSYSNIDMTNAFNKYSKDGHTILSSIQFQGRIENAVKEDLENLTRHIVKTVGDGTTAGVILSAIIFEELCKLETEKDSAKVIREFKEAVSSICDFIRKNASETTVEDIYNIALISTNNNEEVATNIKNIYEEYGMGVFIDVAISNSTEDFIKIYDGLNIDAGYTDSCYINTKNGTSAIRNASVYLFEDPIDTQEMVTLFNTILTKNIIEPLHDDTLDVIPTVVLAPKVSKDVSSFMDQFNNYMYQLSEHIESRPPFLLISGIHQTAQFMDIGRLCGAKPIKKYIDFQIQQTDIEKGLAPTPDNVTSFGGFCELVEADAVKTKFVNPADMKDKDGNPSGLLKAMIADLEAELERSKENNADNHVIGTIKRRLNSLNANMVEYLVGGVTVADRDAVRDLVEDAVLNCRSAAIHGTGYGANFEGLRASYKLSQDDNKYINIIFNAYKELTSYLYSMDFSDKSLDYINDYINNGSPLNIRTMEQDGKVRSSIESDIVILETISKIITLMYTCNQFILPAIAFNIYKD